MHTTGMSAHIYKEMHNGTKFRATKKCTAGQTSRNQSF